MPAIRWMSRSPLVVGPAYVAAYVLLDWLSYVHPFATFGITPWNPQAGLSFALIVLFGRPLLPWLFVAPLTADFLVRNLPLPLGAEALFVLIYGLSYGGAALLLLSPRIGFDRTLSSRRSLLWLMGLAISSIVVVALAQALVLLAYGLITTQDVMHAFLRAFVGDLIGVTVFTPFLLIAFTRTKLPALSWDMTGVMLLVVAALAGVFGLAEAFRFQLFYIFFLPIIWVAVRFGLEGVTVALVAIQLGLIAAIEISGQSGADVVAYQALMVVLSMTGLALGVLVTEQHRTQQQLRMHQEALHRSFRLATMGEFAAAVAHEINQPLTAIGNYSRLAKLAAQKADTDGAIRASSDAIAQVERAGSVIRRLRDFIRVGSVDVTPHAVGALIHEALAIYRPELERDGIRVEVNAPGDLPMVNVDALQVEQVLLNLLRNSAEALTQAGRYDGRISIDAAREPQGMIRIRVIDNGPGLDPALADEPIAPFSTTKAGGLGLGLSLSRSIVEAQGGQLHVEDTGNGVCVSLTLPAARA